MSNQDQKQEVGLLEIMAEAFPGYRELQTSSVTPSVMGDPENPLVSLMIVCNEEAAADFKKEEEVYADVLMTLQESEKGGGQDLHMTVVFAFPLFNLEFYMVILAENKDHQKYFAQMLSKVDKLIVWLVDEDKNLINVLQMNWNYNKHKDLLEKISGQH